MQYLPATTAILATIALAAFMVGMIPVILFLLEKTHNLIEKTKNKYKAMQHQKQIAKQIDSLIAESKGKFFTLKFIKQDGTVRTINSKNRYNRLVKGTGSPATDALKAKGFKNAVDRNREGWYSFKPEKVLEFKCGQIHKTF
jgi:hypothetical protein